MRLVSKVEKDSTKAVREALSLWLKQKLLTCPLTKQFCENTDISCNHCLEIKDR
jgi:hypothetical protein